MSNRRPRAAFTLVELLVVMGLIAVMVCLLLPATTAIRRKAQSTECEANLSVLYSATIQFVSANDGYLPRPVIIGQSQTDPSNWDRAWCLRDGSTSAYFADQPGEVIHGALFKYFGSTPDDWKRVMLCPADRGERYHLGGFQDTAAQYGSVRNYSYSMNAEIAIDWAATPIRYLQVRQPGKHIMIFEEFGPNDGWCLNPAYNYDDFPSNRHGKQNHVRNDTDDATGVTSWQTNGTGNHLFFDGHVESLYPAQIMNPSATYYDPITN